MTENLMDIAQLAEYLQMNKMTVYKLARAGKIPAFKVASEWRFRKDLIDAWLMSQIKGKPEFEGLNLEQKAEIDKTILVVDDEEVIRDYFAKTLTNYKVIKAASGEEALQIIKKDKPDLVLLDIRMPGIDGIETLKRIKQIGRDIAVIMLSAYGTLETNLEAARLGAFSSIAKPFDLKDMRLVVNNALLSEVSRKENAPPLAKPKKTKPKTKKKK